MKNLTLSIHDSMRNSTSSPIKVVEANCVEKFMANAMKQQFLKKFFVHSFNLLLFLLTKFKTAPLEFLSGPHV